MAQYRQIKGPKLRRFFSRIHCEFTVDMIV